MENINSIKVKIEKVDAVIRDIEPAEKRMKASAEYTPANFLVLGVPFGGHIEGRDTDGQAFHKNTDIGLRIGDERPITYYHGFGPDDPHEIQPIPAILGIAKYIKADDSGHWFEPYFDTSEPLAQRVLSAPGETVKASSGAVSHLVRYGKGGLIDNWPVGELALFETNEWRKPANDLAVIQAKSEEVAEVGQEDAVNVKAATVETEDEQPNQPEAIQELPQLESESKMENLFTPEQEADITARIEAVKAEFAPITSKGAPAVIAERGEKDETKGFLHFVRTGQVNSALKASNNTDMNITTNVDGQYLVPTGFYQGVIEKRDEAALYTKLGVTEIPGIGTTVDVPYDNEADGEFVVATETAAFDNDAPATGKKSMTLKKYTKVITISHELLRDEDAKLESFLMGWVGRGMAKTHNDLLITEVESYGTSLKTFASATAVAIGELEAMMYQADMVSYLEGGRPSWVMSGPSYAKVISLAGDPRIYANTPLGGGLLGHPVAFTNKADTIAASKKSIFFGDWSQVGVRTGSGLQLIRDPYHAAATGQVRLVFLFDAVYGVLQPEAIGYGVHPSA